MQPFLWIVDSPRGELIAKRLFLDFLLGFCRLIGFRGGALLELSLSWANCTSSCSRLISNSCISMCRQHLRCSSGGGDETAEANDGKDADGKVPSCCVGCIAARKGPSCLFVWWKIPLWMLETAYNQFVLVRLYSNGFLRGYSETFLPLNQVDVEERKRENNRKIQWGRLTRVIKLALTTDSQGMKQRVPYFLILSNLIAISFGEYIIKQPFHWSRTLSYSPLALHC